MEKKIKQSDFDRLVRRQILRGIKLGYTPDEVVETILRVTEQGFETPIDDRRPVEEDLTPKAQSSREYAKPGVAVVECSLEQSWDMCTALSQQMDYEFFPVMLDTMLKEGKKLIKYLGERTVFVTTPFHFNDVHELLKDFGRDPINLDLTINKDFLKILKSLHKYDTIGVLARDEDSLRAATSLVMAYLKQKGRGTTRVINALLDDEKAMSDIIENAEMVIYAPNCRTEVQELLPWGVKKIEVAFDIDHDSIEELKKHLDKIRF
jgi:hypothetical protein